MHPLVKLKWMLDSIIISYFFSSILKKVVGPPILILKKMYWIPFHLVRDGPTLALKPSIGEV